MTSAAPKRGPPQPCAGIAVAIARRRCCALALAALRQTRCRTSRSPHNTLESLLVAPYPVYWLGRSFQGMAITEATHDPGGAFTVQYGDCVEGGQSTCVPALRVVTSPDNSFVARRRTPQRAHARCAASRARRRAGRARRSRSRRRGVVVEHLRRQRRAWRPRPRRRSCRSTKPARPARRCPRGCPTPASARRRCPSQARPRRC